MKMYKVHVINLFKNIKILQNVNFGFHQYANQIL